ncbi:MAG: two-component regulator propeller domain-containing protein [Bacteroides cellulosilyticus]
MHNRFAKFNVSPAYNGLAQRSVTNILQDSKGFIWFSTWNGLNKFDGYTFKNYKSISGETDVL